MLGKMARRFDHNPPGNPLGELEANALAQAMAAFSTPSRLKLLYALIGIERSVEDLSSATSLSPTVVSQQLRMLRLLRLVSGSRDGHHVRYRLYDDHVADLLAAIRNHGEHAAGLTRSRAKRRFVAG